MGVNWTSEQRKVIELRDRNILVSAAAGSGKTAVLVERIIQRITDEEKPVDIDRLLVMTFTPRCCRRNAGAAGAGPVQEIGGGSRERVSSKAVYTPSQCPDYHD